jgi:hypothetical protein
MPTPTTRLPRDQANPAFATSPFSLVVAAPPLLFKSQDFRVAVPPFV